MKTANEQTITGPWVGSRPAHWRYFSLRPSNWLLVFLLALLAGCSATRDTISMDYKPFEKAMVIKGAETLTVSVSAADMRTDAADIGKKVKEVSWSGVIIVENDLPALVAKALETELARRGFTIGEVPWPWPPRLRSFITNSAECQWRPLARSL